MKIRVNQTFLDGKKRYEKGWEGEVPDMLAGHFVKVGWADPVGVSDEIMRELQPQNVTLEIQSGKHNHEAEKP